jgi:hypothetical protein
MHSVLFVAKIPTQISDWQGFLGTIAEKQRRAKGVLRLAENVWLLDLQESVAPLAWLVSLCETGEFAYGILPFQDAPQWLPAATDPSTTLAHSGRS